MKNSELSDVVLDEGKFSYLDMTLEERNYCLNILNHCKDICDSDYKIDGESKCEFIQLNFKKENNIINVNGFMHIGKVKKENRCINAYIYLEKDKVIVDMNITRLIAKDQGDVDSQIYTVFDEFTLENNVIKRRSQYNYDMKSLYDHIENEEMKGRLK